MDSTETAPEPSTGKSKLPSAFSLFSLSMKAVGTNPGAIIGLMFLPAILVGILFGITFWTSSSDTQWQSPGAFQLIVSLLVTLFICVWFSGALIVTQLTSAKDEHITIIDAFKGSQGRYWEYFQLVLMLAAIYIVSLILFIVPFFFMLERFYLAPFYFFDQNLSPREALRRSSADSRTHGGIWGIIGVTFLIGCLGIIPILGGIASFILSIVYSCAPAIRYTEFQTLGKPAGHHPSHQPAA